MFHNTNLKSILAQVILFTVIVVAGLWMGAWLLSTPSSNASDALPAPLTFQSPIGDPELHIAKSVDDSSPNPGEVIEYTITYSATSTSGHPDPQAHNVQLYDFMPAGVEFVSSVPAAVYDGSSLVFDVGSVGLEDKTATVQVRVLEGYEQLRNHTLVAADRVSATHVSLSTDVGPPTTPWLNLTKLGNSAVLVGNPVIYTIRCGNYSDFPVSGVIVIDVLPDGLSYVDASPPPDTTDTLPLLTWSLQDLGALESHTIVITTTAPSSPGTITNIAIADARQRIMAHALLATEVITEGAILQLTKQGSATEVFLSDKLVYTLQYENVGNQTATGVVLTDTLPSDVVVLGVYPPPTSTSSESLVWDIGQVFTNAPGTTGITVTVWGQGGVLHNVADIASPDSFPGHAEWDVSVFPVSLCLPVVVR